MSSLRIFGKVNSINSANGSSNSSNILSVASIDQFLRFEDYILHFGFINASSIASDNSNGLSVGSYLHPISFLKVLDSSSRILTIFMWLSYVVLMLLCLFLFLFFMSLLHLTESLNLQSISVFFHLLRKLSHYPVLMWKKSFPEDFSGVLLQLL